MTGNPDDLDAWLGEHGASLVLYARQWVDCHADAEDVVHDAFLRFWRRRERVRDPLAYLYRCVRNAAIDCCRRQRRRRTGQASSVDQPTLESCCQDAGIDRRRAALEDALRQLPQQQREVLVLKHWSGLTFEGIGRAVGIPCRTAQSRYRYALEKLRILLAEVET
jgi:RNA polymerase sigma-70 factor (ECF subfamily)